jgi:hypothetical protein
MLSQPGSNCAGLGVGACKHKRLSVFTLFNRAQYGAPSAVFNTASLGQITTQINAAATGTTIQRVSQFSLRATF